MHGELSALARAKEESERILNDEVRRKEEAGRRKASEMARDFGRLQQAKQTSERMLDNKLEQGRQQQVLHPAIELGPFALTRLCARGLA